MAAMLMAPRMALLLCLLVSVVLVFAAADVDLPVAPATPKDPVAAGSSPSEFGNRKAAISNGAMGRDDIPCGPNNEANCTPAKSGNAPDRGCEAQNDCRCCRRMLLEDQLALADQGAQRFATLKDYLTNKFFG